MVRSETKGAKAEPAQAPEIDFDWDDDLIRSYTLSEAPGPSVSSKVSSGSGPLKLLSGDTDPNEARTKKLTKLLKVPPPPAPLTNPADLLRKKQLKQGDLSWALNEMTTEYYSTLPQGPSPPYVPSLPLYLYDDTSQETLPDPGVVIANGTVEGENEASLSGSALFFSSSPEDAEASSPSSQYHSIIGTFKKVLITSYNHEDRVYEGMWYDSALPCAIPRVSMCFEGENRMNFFERFKATLKRRRCGEALIRKDLYIRSMPKSNKLVTASLGDEQAERILSMAHAQGNSTSALELLREVEGDYEDTMNSSIFDCNVMNASNRRFYQSLDLPPALPPQPPKQMGTVPVAEYNFAEMTSQFRIGTFLTTPEAIEAVLACQAESNKVGDQRVLGTQHDKSLSKSEFESLQADTSTEAFRTLKDKWPQKTADGIRRALQSCERYNLDEGSMREYMGGDNAIRPFLERVNKLMTDCLFDITKASLEEYTVYMLKNAEGSVQVDGTNAVTVTYPAPKDGKSEGVRMAPLFEAKIQVKSEKVCLNREAVDERNKEIKDWEESEEAKKPKATCPHDPISEVFGWVFEYTTDPSSYKEAVLKIFEKITKDLQGIHHIQRYVMERLFWPQPLLVGSVSGEEPWWVDLHTSISTAIDKATEPLVKYLECFHAHEKFLNLDMDEYLGSLTHAKVGGEDSDGEEDEEETEEGGEKKTKLVTVNLTALRATLSKHVADRQAIDEGIPDMPLNGGFYSIDATGIKSQLIGKHTDIIQKLLVAHQEHCEIMTKYLSESFESILKQLQVQPQNVEETTELEEYTNTIDSLMNPLKEKIDEMKSYFEILDDFHHKTTGEQSNAKWNNVALPSQVVKQCEDTKNVIAGAKEKYLQDMLSEQEKFVQELGLLEKEVEAFGAYDNLSQVEEVSAHAESVTQKIKDADTKAQLYNSREGLFDKEITDYDLLSKVKKTFEPFNNLWITAQQWLNAHKGWTEGEFLKLDPEACEQQVEQNLNTISKTVRFFENGGLAPQAKIATEIKKQVTAFRPHVPLITALRNPGMRERHWEQLSKDLNLAYLAPDENTSLNSFLELDLGDSIELISKVAESAGKEFQIESALDSMLADWEGSELDIMPYKETGTGILTGVDEVNTILDEHITMTQAMAFSAFKGPFEERIDLWNSKLYMVSEVLEAWLKVQRDWLYLQPIFESPDINKQLPTEGRKFANVDKMWRNTISSAKSNPLVLEFCDNEKLLDKFQDCSKFLDQVQKGLSDYLETKRSVFTRFYFLSNDELLSILSESKDIARVQPHLKKCFEGINEVKLDEDNIITHMISPEGETVPFNESIDPNGQSVEFWLLEVQNKMRTSIRDVMMEAIVDYTVTPRPKWMQTWGSMFVLNGSQKHWTQEMEEHFEEHGAKGPEVYLEQLKLQLADMVVLVRGELKKAARNVVGALTVIDVHARDVIIKLVSNKVGLKSDFLWASQLRYYVEDNNLWADMVAARRPYGYEYLGNTFRLVITPLTDKCYLTLMGALSMTLGGAPAGPAGTGKTETTKDLGKALAMQCVVFNCSDGLDYIAMGKFFKGLASCGAWACFDEFNRINIEVLSVIGQQVASIQLALVRKQTEIFFEGSQLNLDAGFGVFITMNPGYAGRSALPDSLSALFRPVAMMVPDYALIGEIMFFAFGFELAKECGAKMVTTFKLCSEQLSSQPHYDYGMRAVKTVITAAGNLKRAEPQADEMVLLLRALQDVNIPKFLAFDLPLFAGIISDLFPGKKRPDLDYGSLFAVMKNVISKKGLQALPWFVGKIIQLYEMIVVRHGLMLVGPTGGGKSSNLHVLEETLGELKRFGMEGFAYEKVIVYQLNPKSITMGQMYGEFDPNTHEWQDGIMSTMYRLASSSPTSDRKWMLFDGPVDAIWIENMNTVLDDNKKLCLNSGEIIKMSAEMTMMFEVEDLKVASPATVSRVGIIYMEPASLGCEVLLLSWFGRLPEGVLPKTITKLRYLFDTYMEAGMAFVRSKLKELAPTCNNNLSQSLMRILDCYMERYFIKEGRDDPTDSDFLTLHNQIEHLFFFALVWSVGCTVDDQGRVVFDGWIRSEMTANSSIACFPNDHLVYDYTFDRDNNKWIGWMDTVKPYHVDPKASFAEIVVSTNDSVRNTYLMDLLLMNNKHVLMVGETGTGKTININQYLLGVSSIGMDEKKIHERCIPINIAFSAQTSCNMTQDMLDSKMEKRRKGIYGPSAGKQYIVYVDDLNMPKRETYGAQPPVEILRQWFDQGGWYDRKELTFRKLIDLTFICSMGPPGGGRQEVTPRFFRHFNMIGYTELSDTSKALIFETILGNFLEKFEARVDHLCKPMVDATISLFNTIVAELLPTPAKSHYTFNLRDLAKVFQGTLMCEPKKVSSDVDLVRVWCHETKRVFADRLTNKLDHLWFEKTIKDLCSSKFEMNYDDIVNVQRLIYGDYMIPGADPRLYEQVTDMAKLRSTVEEYLMDHNAESKQPMPLVMFMDAIEHVSKIARVLRQPMGNCLLLGVGGSGRQSMTKLATYISGFNLFQVEIAKGYGMTEWREDVKGCLLSAGVKNKPTTFLFSDTQIVDETMLEDINGILNAGDIPNLYAAEDLDNISSACRIECQKKRLPPTKINIFNQYLIRVRANIHVCLAMSPLGETFRDRLRMFPSLVNCSTIDWFSEWPAEALQGVGMSSLTDSGTKVENAEGVVEMFKFIHQSVEKKSAEFLEVLRRHAYVTPTSYLELLGSFKTLYSFKKEEVETKAKRLQIGLDKLASTKDMVSGMKEELAILAPQLVVTQKEVQEMMVHISAEKEEADKVKAKVEVEEKIATEKATVTQAIKDDAQKDLDEALPALDAAVKCLDALKKADIDEVKGFKTPPGGVVLTLHVTCLYFKIKPNKKNDPDNPGKKLEDWFGAGKDNLLTNPNTFMDMLKKYDKDNIPESVIKKVEPFMTDENFTPKMIEKASKACTAICMWARAMYKYHTVAISVAPKKAKLAEAQAELDVVMAQLAEKQSSLAKIVARLNELEANYESSVKKLDSLESQAKRCEIQLANADKLIGGLGGEETRWKKTVTLLEQALQNVVGDILVSSGTVSYLGPFTSLFRSDIVQMWRQQMVELKIPHTEGCDIVQTLSIPVKLRSWQLAGLPTDQLSTENGLIMDKARRWPLFIDPQAQANRYIKNLGKDKELCLNGMDVIKLTEKNFLRALENGVRFGKWVLLENIKEELDASLEPILLQQTFKQGGTMMMKIGDNTIPYSDMFKFFITTKLPNPHYAPEVQVKVSLLNFSITQVGLEEQLLDVVVQEEMPELAEKRIALMIENAAMNKQKYDIESQILELLSNSTGNILDDTVLIETLATAKKTSDEIDTKMEEAKVTDAEIYTSSEEYRPVAYRASLLYFCIADFCTIDPMYQYSLQWFTGFFVRCIGNTPSASDTPQRLENLNNFFTYALYQNICRSLFERHKMLFSFLLTIKIMQGDDKVDAGEWRFLISGMALGGVEGENPDPDWIDANCWNSILGLSSLPFFKGFEKDFVDNLPKWKRIFDSNEPETQTFPGGKYGDMNNLRRMCVLRCLRKDKIMSAMSNFVVAEMEQKFVEPPVFDLKACYDDSNNTSPLIFVLSSGSDPMKDLLLLAENMGMSEKLKAIALGQGQGAAATKMMEMGQANGDWVCLQNCHLSISWMPTLERLCEDTSADKADEGYRLWLTSMPSPSFPTAVLQDGVKMTKEPPKGMRANLKSNYVKLSDETIWTTGKPEKYSKLLFGLCFFHAVVVERKKFGPLGWNIGYTFNETDLDITKAQLETYVDAFDEVPYQVMQQLASVVNYGGRITDDKDMRTSDIIIADFMRPEMLTDDYKFSASGLYYSFAPNKDNVHESYMDYINSLPMAAEPEVFGMHSNASITCDQNDADDAFKIIVSLQPRASAGGGLSREDVIFNIATEMEAKVSPPWDIEAVGMLYPVMYNECLNTVLIQEGQRFNNLTVVVRHTLPLLKKALRGLVVLSAELEAMGTSLFDQFVPANWTKVSYPSLKGLQPWFADYLARIKFINDWIEEGAPPVFWVSGFFFPQGFMTAVLQNHARKYGMPIDTVKFSHVMREELGSELTSKPADGCYIDGLFLEGARWDKSAESLIDPRPKELFSPMCVIQLKPEQYLQEPQEGIYRCPVYKVLTRTGTLSTTGHSTNFVFWLNIPSNKPTIYRNSLVSETNAQVKFCDNSEWIKGGVACFCALKY
ncbi:hypothetical protein TrRE_jg13191 [Triparma retinervis]|uniref:Dynein heavy chain n=1 Tax=Triparma retinervis TaxID=2557542 RepID=A0A9W7ACC1_9STRA|nr:hypothetical protein TrRE_jg13191 [Triparma retinervis]